MNSRPQRRNALRSPILILAVLLISALLAACSTSSPGAGSTAATTPASPPTAASTAGGSGDSPRETAERRLEAIGTQLPAALAAYKNGKTQQAYTMAKSISANLYEGTTEGICSKTDLRDDRQIDPLLAATLPAAIQSHESAGQVAALTTRAQALARGCLNAIHRSE